MTEKELEDTLTALSGRMLLLQMVSSDIVLHLIRHSDNPEQTFRDSKSDWRRKLETMEMKPTQDVQTAGVVMAAQGKALEYLEVFFEGLEKDLREI